MHGIMLCRKWQMPSLELTNNIYSEYPVQVYALNCIAVFSENWLHRYFISCNK